MSSVEGESEDAQADVQALRTTPSTQLNGTLPPQSETTNGLILAQGENSSTEALKMFTEIRSQGLPDQMVRVRDQKITSSIVKDVVPADHAINEVPDSEDDEEA